MIVYDSKKWSSLFTTIIKTFKESYNIRQLINFIFYSGLYATLITLFTIKVFQSQFTIDIVFFSLIGVILSLFLVFRLNTAYNKWWEGRIAWGKLINDSRTLALSLNGLIPADDRHRRSFFVKNIANFSQALQWHLRNEDKHDQLIYINRKYNEDIENAENVPNIILSYLYIEVEHMYEEKRITDFDKQHLKNLFQGLVDVLGICERIQTTPIPFSHSTFIKIFIILYIMLLPFGIVNIFQYLTIPAVMLMAFAMFGVEVISEEIENPFGLDANDLPTGRMANRIRDNIHEILHVKSKYKSPGKTIEAQVLH